MSPNFLPWAYADREKQYLSTFYGVVLLLTQEPHPMKLEYMSKSRDQITVNNVTLDILNMETFSMV